MRDFGAWFCQLPPRMSCRLSRGGGWRLEWAKPWTAGVLLLPTAWRMRLRELRSLCAARWPHRTAGLSPP